MFVALERYRKVDHDAEGKDWGVRLDVIERAMVRPG